MEISQPDNAPRCDTSANLSYLVRDKKHDEEKPYRLRYDPGEDLPRTNCVTKPQKDIRIHDFRGQEQLFSLENYGFTVAKLEPKLSLNEFYDSLKVKDVYYEQLKDLLKDLLRAKKVEILEHVVRMNIINQRPKKTELINRSGNVILDSPYPQERTTSTSYQHR